MSSIYLVSILSGVGDIGATIMFATGNRALAKEWETKYNRIVHNHMDRIAKAMESDDSTCPYMGDFIYYEKPVAVVQTIELR